MTLRVLLVEDDRELRHTLRDALAVEGYAVLTAASLSEGLALVAHAAPARAGDDAGIDLVILDLGLPDGDGETLLAALRRRHSIPVVVISLSSLMAYFTFSKNPHPLRSPADTHTSPPSPINIGPTPQSNLLS